MRADINRVKEGLALAEQMGESMYGKNTFDFAMFMLGALATAVKDLCEHVKELEERLDS